MKPSHVWGGEKSRTETRTRGPSPNLGPGIAGKPVLTHHLAGGLGSGPGHFHLGQRRQIEQFAQ